jgi:hypothetical protein
MAGQFTADLRWALQGSWADKDTWAPYGPGSQMGMCRLHGLTPQKSKYSQEEFGKLLTQLVKDVKAEVGIPGIEAMDVQNCCCEFQKYERTLWGEETKKGTKKTPKQLYPGV